MARPILSNTPPALTLRALPDSLDVQAFDAAREALALAHAIVLKAGRRLETVRAEELFDQLISVLEEEIGFIGKTAEEAAEAQDWPNSPHDVPYRNGSSIY